MRQTNSQGFALPITLIVLSLLVVLSIGLSQMAGLNIAKIKQRQDHLTNELQLKNINQWVLYRLLTGTPSKHTRQSSTFSLPVDNSPIYYQNIKVQVQDAAGLMGLALYNQKKFEKLLKQITDKTSATKIAAQLKDWIDKDSLTSYQGMEVTGYIKTQQPMLPRNHAIRSLDELLELPAITPKLFNGSKNKQGLKEFILAGGTMTHNIATTPNVLLTPMLNISAKKSAQIQFLKKTKSWQHIEKITDKIQGNFDTVSFDQSSNYRIILTLPNGKKSRGLFQIIPLKNPPYRIKQWQYPDNDRG